MNKILCAFLCVLMIFMFVGCGGRTLGAVVKKVDSDLYSEREIDTAIDVIMSDFRKNWDGCRLKTICYAGDETNASYADFAGQYGADEVIVLLSDFSVGAGGGDGSLTPNFTYEGWNWILVRDAGGAWRHVDHGY